MLAHVVKHIIEIKDEMSTKEELRAFRNETAENFREVKAEIADILHVVGDLQGRVGNTEGYSKEIDHLMERVRAIEKHLGIEPRTAA